MGLSREEFWNLSLCELWKEFEVGKERKRDEFERDTTLAWQVVRIYVQTMNKKRMPDLDTLMPRVKRSMSAPSLEQQRAQLEEIGRRYRFKKTALSAA